MLKRIVLGVVLTGFVGLLIVGGINRTLARTGNGTGSGEGSGEAWRGGSHDEAAGQVRRGGSGDEAAAQARGGYGRDRVSVGQTQMADTTELDGTVAGSIRQALTITVSTGETVEVSGRAWSYAQEAGFAAQPGDEVILTGFYDAEGVLEIRALTNRTQGLRVELREADRRPMWVGGGRGRPSGGAG